jgi:hypothetical protein
LLPFSIIAKVIIGAAGTVEAPMTTRGTARLKDELYWVPAPKAKDGQKLPKTPALKDGISLSAAMKLLGPPTTLTDKYVEWYSNPRGRHVAPFVTAKMTKQGLKEWKFGNR